MPHRWWYVVLQTNSIETEVYEPITTREIKTQCTEFYTSSICFICIPRNSRSIHTWPLTDPFVYSSPLANTEAQHQLIFTSFSCLPQRRYTFQCLCLKKGFTSLFYEEQKILNIILAARWLTENAAIIFKHIFAAVVTFSLDITEAFLQTVTGKVLLRCRWFGFRQSSVWLEPTPPSVKAEWQFSWWLPEKCWNSKLQLSRCYYSTALCKNNIWGLRVHSR